MRKGIYKIVNNKNGWTYIGQSVDMDKRWQQHKAAARKGTESLLYRAIRKDGLQNFSFYYLEFTDDLDERERYWINDYKSRGVMLYNSTLGGQCYIAIPKDPNYVSPFDKRLHDQLQELRERNGYEIQQRV